MSSFYVLAMRTINFEKDPEEFGHTEIEELLKHFGEEKVHINSVKRMLFNLVLFFKHLVQTALLFSLSCNSNILLKLSLSVCVLL